VVTRTRDGDVAHLAVVRTADRGRLQEHLAGFGIDTSIHYPILDQHNGPLGANMPPTETPTALQGSRSVLSIPCFPAMTSDQVNRVCDALQRFS
jgi:dTDP-4-amino-4,6-dideoxygalactose transaminase